MTTHRYRVGQTVSYVRVSKSLRPGMPVGDFAVVALLPDLRGENQYRLRSAVDGHERVAVESEIASH